MTEFISPDEERNVQLKEQIDPILENVLKSLVLNEQSYKRVLKAALNNMTSEAISFWIDDSLSKTGKTIWITADRAHLSAEIPAHRTDWNLYPQTLPWENRSGSQSPYLWLVHLKDGRIITAEYVNGWRKWPDHKIKAFKTPSPAPLRQELDQKEILNDNDWNPYPKFKPLELQTYEVLLNTNAVRTAFWDGNKWSYFNLKIIAFKKLK